MADPLVDSNAPPEADFPAMQQCDHFQNTSLILLDDEKELKSPPLQDTKDITCVICLDEMISDFAVVVPCGHCFHTKCIQSYKQKGKAHTCPTCRTKMKIQEVRYNGSCLAQVQVVDESMREKVDFLEDENRKLKHYELLYKETEKEKSELERKYSLILKNQKDNCQRELDARKQLKLVTENLQAKEDEHSKQIKEREKLFQSISQELLHERRKLSELRREIDNLLNENRVLIDSQKNHIQVVEENRRLIQLNQTKEQELKRVQLLLNNIKTTQSLLQLENPTKTKIKQTIATSSSTNRSINVSTLRNNSNPFSSSAKLPTIPISNKIPKQSKLEQFIPKPIS